jgi:hypothetical protein
VKEHFAALPSHSAVRLGLTVESLRVTEAARLIDEAEPLGINMRGEFTPGMPFAYVSDPYGYEIDV